MVGWGQTSYSGKQSNVPLEANLSIVPNDVCQSMFNMKLGFVEPQHLCAYTPGMMPQTQVGMMRISDINFNHFKGKDACLGDSGGPLFASRSSHFADNIERQEVFFKRKFVWKILYSQYCA